MLLQWRTLKPKLLTYYTEKLKLAFLWYSSWATSCDFVSSPTFTFTSAQPTSDRLLFCRAFRGADGAEPKSLPINLSCRARKAKFRGVLVTSDCEKFFHVKSFLSRAWRRFPAVFTLYNLINLSSYHNYIHNDRRWKESLLRLACFVVGEIIMWYTWQVFHNELTTSLALAMIFTIGNTCRHTGASQEIWNWF